MADENELEINIGGSAAGVQDTSKKATAAIEAVTAEAKQLDAAFRRIKSSIDPTFAATEKYNRAVDEGNKLLKAGRISQDEYAAAVKAAQAALDSQLQSINQNSAAVKAAAAAARETARNEAAQAKADALASAQAARQAAREKRDAEIAASREAAAAEREAKAQVRAAAKEAAEAAKLAAREKTAAERQASRESADAEKAAKAEARTAAREAAEAAKSAAQDRRAAERTAQQASRDTARQIRDQAKADREASQAVRELRGSIDPAFAAQERFNDTMRRATSLLMQNKLQQGEWIQIQKQAKSQMDVNVRSMGRMNSVYVQLGYQAQDVTASMASGINPLVILAQQGGQTAAALSMMGGTIGRVASFFAGPWGAAIIGATMLLGFYIQKNKESEKATKDATNAEDLRKMKLQELTQALKDFNKEQREANLNSQAQRQERTTGALTQLNEANRRVTDLQKKLKTAKDMRDSLMSGPGASEAGSAILLFTTKVTNLEKQLATAQKNVLTAQSSVAEARLGQVNATATAMADEREAIRSTYEAEESAIQKSYQTRVVAANKIQDAGKRSAEIGRIELDTQNKLTAAKKKEADAQEALAKSKRDERSAPRRAAKEAKDAVADQVEAYTYEQSLAGEDYRLVLEIQDKKIKALRDFYGASSKEAIQAQRERVGQEKLYQLQLLEAQQQGIDRRLAAAELESATQKEIVDSKIGKKSDTTAFRQQEGLITDKTATTQRAAQLEEMYQLEVGFENRLFLLKSSSLRDRLALENLPVRQRQEITTQLEVLEAAHTSRMTIMAAQHERAVAQVQMQGASQTMAKWKDVAASISQSLNSSFQGMWQGTMTWQQSMFNLADQLIFKWVDAGAKILERWIVQQATKTAVTAGAETAETAIVATGEAAKTGAVVAGTATRVGVTAAGAVAEEGINITSALTSIGLSAAKAAAGAYAAIAGIPVVGPFLAPVAAATALVAVRALGSKLASARGGQWQVPNDGQITELHRDEMVLPAWAAKPLRSQLTAPSSSGMIGRAAAGGAAIREGIANDNSTRSGDTNHWHINAVDAKSFARLLHENPRALQSAMKTQVRNALGKS